MQYITDLHIHSKYSRACSQQLTLENIGRTCQIKGIDIVATADFTFPAWRKDLNSKLEESEPGIFKLKKNDQRIKGKEPTRFLLSTEISTIYKKNDQTRRLHTVIWAPSLDAINKISETLDKIGNIKSDGRPILGLDVERLGEICLEADKNCLVIPAHIWTPWFAMFGSKSGFDTMAECWGDFTKHIHAIETGLSSDPPMNWRIKELDNLAIVSNSDAHSPANLAREGTVFDLEKLSFDNIADALKNGYRTDMKNKNKIDYTIEFFPEEGRYHYDGHRNCKISLNPEQTKKNKGLCPKCKKPLTVGVLNRVQELADRKEGYVDKTRPPFKSLIPLQEVIAEAYGVGKSSKRVQAEYYRLCEEGKNEFNILLNLPVSELKKITEPLIAAAIDHMRQGEVKLTPGYDGEYGKIEIFTDKDRQKNKPAQLF